jgi:nucleotide-binding universal stress UspA family protein
MKYNIKNILVPTDFSETANNALNVAIAMATRHNATLHLINSVRTLQCDAPLDSYKTGSKQMLLWMNAAKEHIEKHKNNIVKHYKLEVKAFAEFGSVAASIGQYVKENEIDLVVMGTHGNSGWKEFFIGSNALAVIKECTCPVLTIPPGFTKTSFDSILYPVRNVSGALEKYEYIKTIMQANKSKIHLLGIVADDDFDEFDLMEKKLKEIIEYVKTDKNLITFETSKSLNISSKILDMAHKRRDDLMIINSTLDFKWKKFFSGSYTQQVVNHAHIPVLSVKPELTPEFLNEMEHYLVAEANYYTPLAL